MRSSPLAVALCTALFAASSAAQVPRPTILVVGTGGTIGMSGNYWGGRATLVPLDQLVRVPGIDSVATVESEQFFDASSIAIGPARWLELAGHIRHILRVRPELRGIVITHGTDTMEETAYFLDLTVGDVRPVVVTGAMRPSSMAGADGPANITNAVRSAADTNSRGRGTMVMMDDRLFAARDVTKANSTRVEAFQAPDRGPLAIIDPEGVYFRTRSPNRATAQFDVSMVRELPRVDIIYSYPGADSVAIDAVVAAGARGLVIAGVGRGFMTGSQAEAVRRAALRGVTVVASTRAGSGRVPVGERGPMIGSGDLNPQKARILLMLALSRTSDPARIRTIFSDNQ